MAAYEVRMPQTLGELFAWCETECVAGCCGLEAFDFSRERIREWVASQPQQAGAAREQLRQLVKEIAGRSEEEIRSDALNAWWVRAEAVEFFSGLAKHLDGDA